MARFILTLLLQSRRIYLKLWFYGNSRYCPLCNSTVRKFLKFGLQQRADAQCPVCGSLERHRLLWIFLSKHSDFLDRRPKTMLHVAPESCLAVLLASISNLDYISADLRDPLAMVKLDITHIPYPDKFFDVIYCSHVLEHVERDQEAMKEFHRVMKDKGWAVLIVPIQKSKRTIEDQAVVGKRERERLFGGSDHRRYYCSDDFMFRLSRSGFQVIRLTPNELMPTSEITKFAVKDRELFICRKEAEST